MDDFLDYLTQEMEATFRLGRQIWDKPDNFRLKRKLVEDAVMRTKACMAVKEQEKDDPK